ncbi:ABC transporter ATP-binding protein AmfA [Streptomyces sp. GBA 94-10 4N24]|uniref:ATP-binding cassette domain-containing protein n=1 Tax=Streptomyces sp. GBA 94-10 4N24 TaxID=1218177 RepID=UPI0003C335A4|nr:ABC transporter ATP-binding protein [Streptomyces sp. GBA 94-10 4N24]ESP98940.1 ABC transporter ATP-binding protein AmfA [Streptomyces sp. GBA 94-10 4N24]UZN59448.1 ABC transporter ATP-binding protein AmfA [Streptomyces sp. GBA 94-10 4N24]
MTDRHAPGATPRPLLRPALTFARRRKGPLGALAAWSLLESARTFLTGHAVARALDDGFLASDVRTGLLWLLALAAAALTGGLADAGVFRSLGSVIEPLRDSLVRRVVRATLTRAATSPTPADTARVSRLTAQTEIARDAAGGVLLTVRSFLFTSVGALTGLAALSPRLLPLVLIPLAAGLALFAATLRPMAARQRDLLDADEHLAAFAGRTDHAARDIAATGAAPSVTAEAAPLITAEATAASALARWSAVRVTALGLAAHLPVATLLLAAPTLLSTGLTPGELLAALTYVTTALLPAVNALLTALGTAGSRLLVVLHRLLGEEGDVRGKQADVLGVTDRVRGPGASSHGRADEGPAIPAPPLPGPGHVPEPSRAEPSTLGPRPTRPAPPAATLCGVTFAYGPDATPVLDHLDLTVQPGEHLLVVGPSGAGKSTLLALLAGTAHPRHGQIHLGGHTARHARTLGTAARVLVPQEPYIFEAPLRDNLTYLAPDAPGSRITEALDTFALTSLATDASRPLRPDRLTPSERRRIALARAWLTPSPLLLLDEPTAHLDAGARAATEPAFASHPATVITVSHHFPVPEPGQRVLLLDGATPYLGTHASLLQESALYRELAAEGGAAFDGGDPEHRVDLGVSGEQPRPGALTTRPEPTRQGPPPPRPGPQQPLRPTPPRG